MTCWHSCSVLSKSRFRLFAHHSSVVVWSSSQCSPQSLHTNLLTVQQLHPPPSQPITHKYPSVRNTQGSHGSEFELHHNGAWHCVFWQTSVSERPEASVCIKPEDGGSRFFWNAGNRLLKLHDAMSKKIVLILPLHSLQSTHLKSVVKQRVKKSALRDTNKCQFQSDWALQQFIDTDVPVKMIRTRSTAEWHGTLTKKYEWETEGC